MMNVSSNSRKADKKTLCQFGLILSGGFIVIFGLFLPWLWERMHPIWPWIAALVLGLTALKAPMALAPVYRVWMKVGHALGWVNTRIILGLVFFAIFLPVGLMRRLLGKDSMARRMISNQNSYRIPSKPSSPEQMERPF